jgi:hypothetical protein
MSEEPEPPRFSSLNKSLPLSVRMRAAIEAAPNVSPPPRSFRGMASRVVLIARSSAQAGRG